MTRTAFDHQLAEVQENMVELASMVKTAIERSVQALEGRDIELAHRIIDDDLKINRKRYETEEKCWLATFGRSSPCCTSLSI